MSDLVISRLQQVDTLEAAHVISLAMVSCPIHVAVFRGQDDETRRAQERMFEQMLRHRPGLVYGARLDGHLVGVLRLRSCQGRRASQPGAGEGTLRDSASRAAHWQAVWAHHDPSEPHWHLGPVSVLPPYQGTGVGTALMQRFCQEVDARQGAAFLETDRFSNVRFYQKFGFQVVDEVDIFEVRNYFMWRPPSRAGGHVG